MNRRAFVTLCIAIFVAMLGMGIISPLLPVYANKMGASGIWLGMMAAGYSLARAITQPVYGWISDHKGRKMLLIGGLAFYTLISVVYTLAGNIYQLTTIRLLHGFASASVIPVAQAYIGDIVPKGKEGTYMGIFSMAQYLGMAAGPLMGGTLADMYNINTAFYTMAVFAGAGLILLILFVPSVAPHARKSQVKAAPMMIMLGDDKIKAISLYLGARGMLRQSISQFLPLYALQTFGTNMGEGGLLVTVYILTEALSQLFIGPIADRMNRKILIIAGGIFPSVLGLFLNRMGGGFAMIALLVPIALMSTVGRIPALAYNVELGQKYGRMGSSMGITNAAQDMGYFLGPLIAGWSIDYYGIGTLFYSGSIAGLITLPIMIYWLYTKDKEYHFEPAREPEIVSPPK